MRTEKQWDGSRSSDWDIHTNIDSLIDIGIADIVRQYAGTEASAEAGAEKYKRQIQYIPPVVHLLHRSLIYVSAFELPI